MDENHSENERNIITNLVKAFPDPQEYLIGFACISSLDTHKRSTPT